MTKAKKQDQSTKSEVITVSQHQPDFTPAMKLERLSVREKIKASLNLPKEGITSREAGYIDIAVSASLYATGDALSAAVQQACSSNGIECQIISSSSSNGLTQCRFTNALMVKQGASAANGLGWGSRGNSRQARVLVAAATTPVVEVAPVVKPEAKASKAKKPAKVK